MPKSPDPLLHMQHAGDVSMQCCGRSCLAAWSLRLDYNTNPIGLVLLAPPPPSTYIPVLIQNEYFCDVCELFFTILTIDLAEKSTL